MKKWFSLVLCFALLCGILCNRPIKASATGLTLAQLQAKFPDGAYWNHIVQAGHGYPNYEDVGPCNNPDGYTWVPCDTHNGNAGVGGHDCNSFNGGMQCFGFARKLGYDAYGSYPSSWNKTYDLSNIKPGDIIRYDAGQWDHSIFVTGVNGDTITFGDCNNGGRCLIKWNRTTTKSALSGVLHYVESAPYALVDSTPTPAQDPWIEMWDVTDITETDAKLNANIRNPGGAYISTVGCTILDHNSQVLTTHYEPMNPKFHTADNVPMWFWMNSEVGMTLTKGTLYKYQLLIIRSDEKTFYSDIFSFQTAGSHALNFHPEGGSCNTTSKQVINGAPVGDLPIPQRSGYTFDGWYQGNTRVTADSLFLLSNGRDLYARWIKDALPGDLDKDGEVTIADVMEACKVMAREAAGTDPTADEMVRGDLDEDGGITIADVMEICKILARKN